MVAIDKIIETKRKSLKLEITPLGELYVYVPKKMSIERIKDFINLKSEWIINNQNKIKTIIQFNQDIINYKKILLLGEQVNIIEKNSKNIELIGDNIFIPNYINKLTRIIKIEKYIKSYATNLLNNRVNYFANLMQLEPNSIKLSNAKKRWGSCDSNGNILFNWRVIMLAPNLIDYIIIHELAHLIELNHSFDFWSIVASIMPNWKECRQELKKCNFVLMTFRDYNL